MEKYGVQEEPTPGTDKHGAEQPEICPECGTPLDQLSEVGVLKCPQCGTKPFEKR